MKETFRRVWARIDRWFPWIALVGVVVGLALAVRSQWSAITELDWAGSWTVLLASAALFAAAPLAQAGTFWIILRLLGARAPFGEAMVIWAHSYVLRYAPSGALAVVYRVRERVRLDATRDQILAAEAYEHLGSLTAGACACLLGFAVLGSVAPWLGLGWQCRWSWPLSPSDRDFSDGGRRRCCAASGSTLRSSVEGRWRSSSSSIWWRGSERAWASS